MNIIETDRVTLKEAKLEDADFFFELLNSPNWIRFIGDRSIRSRRDAENYIESSLIKSYRENGFGLYLMSLKSEDTPIGICGLLQRTYLDQPDIGFAVLSVYEGKGYTLEAAEAIIDWGSKKFKLEGIYAITTHSNIRSQRLLKRLGMKEKGTVKPSESDPEFLLYHLELTS